MVDRIVRSSTIDEKVAARLSGGARAELQRLYFDTVTSTGPENLGAILHLAGSDKLLSGSDYSFGGAEPLRLLDRCVLTPTQRGRVAGGNAATLIAITQD